MESRHLRDVAHRCDESRISMADTLSTEPDMLVSCRLKLGGRKSSCKFLQMLKQPHGARNVDLNWKANHIVAISA